MKEILLRFIWLVMTSAAITAVSMLIETRLAFAPGWGGWIAEGFAVFGAAAVITAVSSLVFYRGDLMYMIGVVKRMLSRKS